MGDAMKRAGCAAKQLVIVFPQSQLLSEECLVLYGFFPPTAVNTALAPGLPEFIREHPYHAEPSCTKVVGREGQISLTRAELTFGM